VNAQQGEYSIVVSACASRENFVLNWVDLPWQT